MIKPLRDRLLVKLLPRYESKIPIVLVDKQKHFSGVRRGTAEYLGPRVRDIKFGDTIYFGGDAGESFGMDSGGINDGTEWRQLRESDVLAVEEFQEGPHDRLHTM